MASHGNDNLFSSNQPQMRRDGSNAPSDIHNQSQGHDFLQEMMRVSRKQPLYFYEVAAGTQVNNMAQGAADIGKGAAQGAVSVARGAALGAANIAQGAADAVKNTVGGANNDNAATGGIPNYLDEYPKHNPTTTKI